MFLHSHHLGRARPRSKAAGWGEQDEPVTVHLGGRGLLIPSAGSNKHF